MSPDLHSNSEYLRSITCLCLFESHQLGLDMIAQLAPTEVLSQPLALWVHLFELIPPACLGFMCGAWCLCDLQHPHVVADCGLQCNLRNAYALIMH